MGKDQIQIQFGIETEIGIARDGVAETDVVAESMALVRSATKSGVLMRWDYDCEDPHADARGFHVRELLQDTDEAEYSGMDAERGLTNVEIKSDIVLGNGARLYNDHAHPEYCTPECDSVSQLVAHDRAGERILMYCARKLSRRRGATIRLYKNNTDFLGHSYGCHENYLLPRSLTWESLASGIQAFLVTRQVFAGAGKFGIEEEDHFISQKFQISQRSDFFSELQSVDTMQRRPIINTRDEPHANPDIFRRFHVIIGDANMSPWATRLKVGTTALVLEAIARNPARYFPRLTDPICALVSISRDPRCRCEVGLENKRRCGAIAIQREYARAVAELCDLSAPEKRLLLADWTTVLDDLEKDPMLCGNRLDWVAKLAMIGEFQKMCNISDGDPWLRSLDLEYHRLDAESGLYYALEQQGGICGAPTEDAVFDAMISPPATTRAYIRGRCVQKFPDMIISAQWDHITLQGSGGPLRISMMDMFTPQRLAAAARIVDSAESPDDLEEIAD